MKRFLAISLAVVLALGLAPGAVMALTQPSVSLTNHEISYTADYSVTFTIFEDVAEGEDIIVEFSTDTDISGITNTDTDSDVTVAATSGTGSTAFNATAAGSSSADTTLTITVPDVNAEDMIGAGATVQVVVSGAVNPTEPGCYTLLVSTSAETTPVESNVYAITAPLIPHWVSIPTEQNIISKADADYTIQFSLDAELGPTDDIVLAFPSDTVLSEPTATVAATIGWIGGHCDDARLDNVTWAFDTTARTVTATLSTGDAIGELAHVRIEITAGICNPSVPGDYTLTVHTSQETTPVESNAYAITIPPDPSLPGIVELYNPSDILMFTFTGDDAITDAIASAGEDYTIKVYTGTYTTNVDVNVDHLTIQSENGPEVTTVRAASSNDHVFEVTADNVTISGFTVTGATSQAGIYLASGVSGCSIYDNDMTNNYRGIHLDHSNNNTLRNNSVTPSAWMGIELSSASSNTLTNNSVTSSSWHGIALYSSDNNTLTNNNASSNNDYGIFLNNSSDNTLTNNITSNNDYGIFLSSSSNNTISGNICNLNSYHGICLYNSSNNTIGGTTASVGNTIAFNGGDGVVVEVGIGNAIQSNSIFSNAGLGIDLSPNGVTPNDPGDSDTGANNLQNFPVLTSATSGSTTIEGTLNSTPNTQFRLEFFSNDSCDPSGYGEGETFLGTAMVMTDGSGNASFAVTFPDTVPVGQFISATATDPNNNTSEFSECIAVAPRGVFLSPSSQAGYGSPGATANYTLEVANRTGADDSFDLSVSGNAWPTSLSIDNTGIIPDGESISFTVEVEVPATASPGDTDAATITATSVTDPTMTDNAIVTTTATPSQGIISIRAYIDGRSLLIIRENIIQWHHLDWAAPGRLDFVNLPTIINGIEWYPEWPDVPDEENRRECFSSMYEDLSPPLPKSLMELELSIIQARYSLSIAQYPSADNAYTLIIDFNDNPLGGAAWYECELTFMVPPVADFSAEPISGVTPLTVEFTDKSTGDITSCSWDFGDGGTSDEQSPFYTYTIPGTYTVSLSVSGPGGTDIETKECYIIVYEQATVDFDPNTLNLGSKGKWATTYIELQEGYDVNDIDVGTILLNDSVSAELKPVAVGDHDSDGVLDLMVKFNRASVQGILTAGDEIEVTVSGELIDDTRFEGTDTIRVIEKGRK